MFKKEKNSNLTSKTTLRKIKKQVKGITLIALVVTIIVLLILAGVALNLTIGENGLFTRAQNAANTWQLAEQNEQNAMNNLASWMDSVLGSNNSGNNQNTETLVDAFKSNKIKTGDYIDYINPSSDPYTSPADRNGYANQTFEVDPNMKWRVLGLSEDGNHLLITTEKPIGKSSSTDSEISSDQYYYLQGAEGAFYSVDYTLTENGKQVTYNGELDNICSIYANNYADETRSITADDINNLLGLVVIEEGDHKGVFKKSDIEEGNYSEDKNIIGSIGSKGLGDSITWKDGWNTPVSKLYPEQYLAPEAGTNYPLTSYAYWYLDISNLESFTPNSDLGITETIYDMLFRGTENLTPYWLACIGGRLNLGYVSFGPGSVVEGGVCCGNYDLFYSKGNSGNGKLYVRPVVSLKSDVSINDINVTSTELE